MKYEIHDGLKDVVDRYDAFILDQYGVMHNGKEALPYAIECINHLHNLGKKLVILSNTASPSNITLERLPKLGFNKACFVGAVTSGDEATKYIKNNFTDSHTALVFINNKIPQAKEFLRLCGEGINLVTQNDAENIDVIVLHGSESICFREENESGINLYSLDSFLKKGILDENILDLLRRCAQGGIPMICANSDFIALHADGSVRYMPGTIAKQYEDFGGKVNYFGKPHKELFDACISKLRSDRKRVAHVGDSLLHDIKGANNSNIDSIFISTGIHAKDLDLDWHKTLEHKRMKLDSLFYKESGIFPTLVLPYLKF